MNIRHLSLDCWNCLITPNPSYAKARNDYLSKELNIPIRNVPTDLSSCVYTRTKRQLDNMVNDSVDVAALTTNQAITLLLQNVHYECNSFAFSSIPELARRIAIGFIVRFLLNPPTIEKRVVEKLKELDKKGYSLSITSNTNFISGDTIRKFLIDYKIPFKFTLFSDLEGVSKPNPAMFFRMFSKSGVDKTSEIVHIGDNDLCDGIGPQRLGINSIVIKDATQLYDTLNTL